jgi:hypothetical protein
LQEQKNESIAGAGNENIAGAEERDYCRSRRTRLLQEQKNETTAGAEDLTTVGENY